MSGAFGVVLGLLMVGAVASGPQIRPGEVWLDNRGQPIQAHGGGILKHDGAYYWFGEYRGKDLPASHRAVGCYRSTDLVHWTWEGLALDTDRLEDLGPGFVLERPKVFYSRKTREFVMYMHADSADYKAARVGVAVSKRINGPYKVLRTFRPFGQESRDIGQFIDDDGSAYLIFEDRPHGFHIAQLSEDRRELARDVLMIPEHLEGGALVHYKGLYYCVGSHLSGWAPNPNVYARAKRLEGPWSEWRDIAPPETKTYGAQSSMLLRVDGRERSAVIFMGDAWKPKELWDSRYLWMPVEIGDGGFRLPRPRAWSVDVGSGRVGK
ncbi:MAG TPA: family 43 glycosylhydrolase [Bryobacteraceae bacterium]|jgi:hypothetical protein|nr:family 43 glycosylhydrolase [Bryobacteraceae bacterium]